MKKLLLYLNLLVFIGVFAACGNDSGTADTEAQTVTQTSDEANVSTQTASNEPTGTGSDAVNWDEHVNFTWWMIATPTPALDFYTDYSDNPVTKYLEHRFNVSFTFEQPAAGTDADALALMMGSGRYTDVINLAPYTGSVGQLYEDGIIIDIAEWLDYMPNFRSLLETYPEIARATYDDLGRILMLPHIDLGAGAPWAGLVYRHDILETMTDSNIQFPSGNDAPTTLADWEYMLPIFLDYFEQAGFADFAPLILPANPMGMFHWGELMSGFGGYYLFYVRNDEVRAGMFEPAMFNYVDTMRDWFERGWIHQDFSSRTTDMFFMPNPPLTFGGAAGSFYSMLVHLADRMSVPEEGMFFDVRPIASPLAPGVTQEDMLRRRRGILGTARGHAIYSGNANIGRFLAIMDFFYSEEGGMMKTLGLTADQIAPNDTMMTRMGVSEGVWWNNADGLIEFHPNMHPDTGNVAGPAVNGLRFPGVELYIPQERFVDEPNQIDAHAEAVWGAHDDITEVLQLPEELTPTADEAATLSANSARFTDFINQRVGMFIMGTAPLDETSWNEFLDQLREFGYLENRDIWQAAYDRWLVRGQ
jgi:putative aldouronate transport system substrate-binding protein